MAQNLVQINLLGTQLSLKTDENPEYLQTVIRDFEERLRKTRLSISVSDPLKVAILTGILVTEELRQEKTRNRQLNSKLQETEALEEITRSLIAKIDEVL